MLASRSSAEALAHNGAESLASYASAKTGAFGPTRALAVELAEHAILVNAILPGWFETNLTRKAALRSRRADPPQDTRRQMGKPRELLGATTVLAASASDFITGGSGCPAAAGTPSATGCSPEPRLASGLRE